MIKKISQNRLIFFQILKNPVMATECLFSDLGNLASFEKGKYSQVRKYQWHFLSWDTLFFYDKKLTKKQNWTIKNGLAESYIFGGRLTGKSAIGLIVDCILALLNNTFRKGSVGGADAEKIKKVMEQIFVALEYHPFFKLLNIRVKRNPYQALTLQGVCLESVNANIAGKNPGGNYHGRHDEKSWFEESSFITDKVAHEKLMAQAESGCINHYSGMTNFAKESPIGKIFNDLAKNSKIINLPSYVNPTWDKEKDDAAIQEFGGVSSAGYKVQILGEIVSDGESVYDMDRVRSTYIRDRDDIGIPVKSFEINTKNFYRFKEIIIIDKPKNCEKCSIALDIGEGSAPTEIIVLFQTNEVWKYEYNITTFKISPSENELVVRYIIEVLQPNIISVDNTSGCGKSLVDSLQKQYAENIIAVDFNKKIDIGFEVDEKGTVIYNNGVPLYKQEYITDWSVQRLKHLFYNGKVQCLYDLKLDAQFAGVIVKLSGQKTLYGYKTANHLYQAWQVFAIADWITEFKNIKPANKFKKSFGAFDTV